jgi:hypothetical protein
MRPIESPNRSQRGSCPAVGTTRQNPLLARCTRRRPTLPRKLVRQVVARLPSWKKKRE